MKGFSKIAFVLMMSLMLLAGCKSQMEEAATVVEAPVETAVPADIPAAPVQQTEEAAEDAVPATELEPAVPAGPVSSSYSYHGYTLDIQAYDGYAVISYPSIVTRSDVDMYLAELSAVLPDLASDVTYSFDSDTELRLVYPEESLLKISELTQLSSAQELLKQLWLFIHLPIHIQLSLHMMAIP